MRLTDVHGLEYVVRETLGQIRGVNVAVNLWALASSDARSSQHAPQLVVAGLLIVAVDDADVDLGDHRAIGRLVSSSVAEESEQDDHQVLFKNAATPINGDPSHPEARRMGEHPQAVCVPNAKRLASSIVDSSRVKQPMLAVAGLLMDCFVSIHLHSC